MLRARAVATWAVLAVAGTWLATMPAFAKRCGDAVDGADVPCACGDFVVSNLTLSAADPVTHTVCPQDGLVVRSEDGRGAIRVDLHGFTLRGSGVGSGLQVVDGGPGGARIVSGGGSALLIGFDDGVTARGSDGIALLEDVVVRGSHRDGVRLGGRGSLLRRVVVEQAKRDGFSLSGDGFEVFATRASDSGRFGYSVMGDSGTIGRPGDGNVAERSGMAGFNIMGIGHVIEACVARDGRKAGVALQATRLDVRGCTAQGNGTDGISGIGSRWQLADNRADDNGGDGLRARGPGMIDAGGNRGSGNAGGERQRDVVQCSIGGAPCAL
ncbi:MAG: right-handed parallel beta-helix repeat-containing protein [Deltaproteobacteria bacterium]|nr:right-handed parallel beta-helix repeat-containing protein [Deltaproteobacteria bacterium]